MATPLDEATKQAVLAEAQNRANRFGISKEQALYNYAVENGIDNASVDTMMGFAKGGTDAWLKQTSQPLAQDHRAAVLAEAQNRAKASGKSAEQELYDYAHKGGIDNAGIDTLMGFAKGGTDAWLKQTYQPLAQDHRAAVLAEAQNRAKASGKSAEQELYDYAHKGGIDNAGIDTLMGFAKGGTDAWLKQTSQQNNQQQQGNLGMGGGYNPQQNPYLRQMGVDVGNQMFDQWSRNTLPSIRSGAMAAGGFGGSRQGVVEANGINDMNRQYGQALTSMYGNDWSQQQGRNLQQQGLNNSYDLGLRSNELQNRSVNNSYDLGLRSSDLGFANLDANINQNNFNNQLASANFGMGVYNTLNNQTQAGIQAGTNIQNTPLDYQKYFSGSANSAGGNGGTGTTSQTNQGNPWLGAVGGAVLGNQFQKNWSI